MAKRKNPDPPGYRFAHERFADEHLDAADILDAPEVPAAEADMTRGGLTVNEAAYLQAVVAEMSAREQEALALYEPLPAQEQVHASQASERLVIGGNRGGKTLTDMVELARAITGQDPHHKYSLRDGVAIAVGKDLRHCAKVFYEMLFKPGAFRVIKDPETGRTRSFRPGQPWDEAHRHLTKPAPPLVPKRFYREKDVSWENKREGIIKSIKIHATGWVLNFFSSLGAPPQGWRASLVVFDEEIEHPQWYSEVSARLPDFRVELPGGGFLNGRFLWGATPQAGTIHLFEMSETADRLKEAGDPNPVIEKFHISLLDNPHISQPAKDDLMRKLVHNEDEYNVRILGHFAIQGSRVFPEFMPKGVHGVEYFPIPEDWTRYMALDPGRQVCAALFIAVPPPNVHEITLPGGRPLRIKDCQFVYDELYIRRSNASIFADALRRKLIGSPPIHEWWIDYHNGRITEIGSGVTHEVQFSRALKRLKVKSEKNGYTFTWAAATDVKSGLLAVREKLHVRDDGTPEWYFLTEKLPNFVNEAKNYVYKKVHGTNMVTDEPWQRNNHLMDCARYLATARLRYVKPSTKSRKGSSVLEQVAAIKERARRRKQKDSGAGSGIKLW